jgi:glycosyltransferase involved in cell wall biosynthesis
LNSSDLAPACRRLAVVLSHPTQYYSPWFRWLAAHAPAIDLRLFYLWEFGVTARLDPQFGTAIIWDNDLLSGYSHEFVPNTARDPGTHHFGGLRNSTLTNRLAAWRPDALLLFGYNYATHIRVILWARAHGVPLIFRGDSHFLGRTSPGWLKLAILRLLYRQFAAITYVGQANREYFRRLSVPESRLHFAPHAVDDSLYDPARVDHLAAAQKLRSQLDLQPDARVILYAGKLVPAKQPMALLSAYLTSPRADSALIFVGDGEERTALVAAAGGAPDVHFLPFANQSEMPVRYLLADIFALPSSGQYETWGLAVNEAMHMGVPCLVSDRVGCQRDLVTEGDTGWIFRAAEPTALAPALAAALQGVSTDREGFRRRVHERIAGYTYATAAQGLLQAVTQATAPDKRVQS